MKEKLGQKIEKELEVVFEPIFSYEDVIIAAYLPFDGIIQWKMDTWAEYVYDKFRQLNKYFRECNIQFINIEQFTSLVLIRMMEHEIIHSIDVGNEINEVHMQYITNKLFSERLINTILETTYEKITRNLPRIRKKEKKQERNLEVMLSKRGKRRCVENE